MLNLVQGDIRGATLLLTLNRPERLNALSRALLEALDEWIQRASKDPEVRAVVVTGAGDRAFSAGADIDELRVLSHAEAYAQMRFGQGIFERLERLPKPVIAAVNGYALGGGCELAMACDLRFAADHARFGQPEIQLGNLPGWGGTQRLPRLIGPARAKELIFTGEPIAAPTASAIGLVNRVYPAADLLRATLDFAASLAAKSAVALALAKESIHIGLDRGPEAGFEAEAQAVAHCCTTPEQHAAVAAFLARRIKRTEAGQG